MLFAVWVHKLSNIHTWRMRANKSSVSNKHPLTFAQLPRPEGTLPNANKALAIAHSLLYRPRIPILDERMRLFGICVRVLIIQICAQLYKFMLTSTNLSSVVQIYV